MLFLINLAAVAAAAAGAGAPVVDMDATASAVVRYDDLNLASAGGERRLQRRIAGAAQQVCGEADGRDLKAMDAVRQCRSTVQASAKPRVTTALAEARNRDAAGASGTVAALVQPNAN